MTQVSTGWTKPVEPLLNLGNGRFAEVDAVGVKEVQAVDALDELRLCHKVRAANALHIDRDVLRHLVIIGAHFTFARPDYPRTLVMEKQVFDRSKGFVTSSAARRSGGCVVR